MPSKEFSQETKQVVPNEKGLGKQEQHLKQGGKAQGRTTEKRSKEIAKERPLDPPA
jgi:hypothetical protein